ncbi:MAG: sulfatase-like hydrolase/transferase [Acidobacteriota bacterium]
MARRAAEWFRAAHTIVVLAAAGLAFGCHRSTPPPLILISIDTLRADRLPAWGSRSVQTPAIDALARDSVLFENAYSHYPLTLPSHTTLLSGLLPPNHGVRDNIGYTFDAKQHPFLPQLLAERGYSSGAFVSSYVLRPETGLGAAFSAYDSPTRIIPGAPIDSAERPGQETVAAAAAWLATQAEGPFFAFVHFYEPHAPYTPPEPFKSRYPDPYDGEIATADAAVGELLQALRAHGLYDQAAIALVADHGEGLGDHGEKRHGVFLYRSTLHVPLLLKLPRQEDAGRRVTTPVGLVDVAPTLVALAGAQTSSSFDGRSLLTTMTGEGTPRTLYAETYYPRLHFGLSDLQAAIESRWYLIDGPQPELFDLAKDAAQADNRLESERREYVRLRGVAAASNRPLASPSGVDPEAAAHLAALGYLAGPGGPRSGALPDPRSQRDLLAEIQAGFDAFFEHQDALAIDQFQRAIQRRDSIRDVWMFLARALDRQGRSVEALAAWDRTLALSAGDPVVTLQVGERHLALGHPEEARQLAETARAGDPNGAENLLIEVDLAEGKTAEADRRIAQSLANGSASETTRRRVALAALSAGDPARAVTVLEPVRESGETASLVLLSLALADRGANDEALALLDRAHREAQPPAEFFESLGLALLRLDRLDRARTAFEEAVRSSPDLASAWNSLGIVRFRQHETTAATAAWQQAVKADPTLLDAWYNLGLTAAKAGDRPLARSALTRYLDLVAPRAGNESERRTASAALARLGSGQ